MSAEREYRYVFHCVAPGVCDGPMPTDDLDEALLATASYHGSHWDIWDTVERRFVQPIRCEEDLREVQTRAKLKHPHERCVGMGV